MAKKKSIPQLMQEWQEHRKMLNKTYVHNRNGESYQLLHLSFTHDANELVCVYCYCAMPSITFTRCINQFKESFTELGELK